MSDLKSKNALEDLSDKINTAADFTTAIRESVNCVRSIEKTVKEQSKETYNKVDVVESENTIDSTLLAEEVRAEMEKETGEER